METATRPSVGLLRSSVRRCQRARTRWGWTAGAGVEKKFNRNWSAKLEYLYIDLGSVTYFGGTANSTSVSFHDHVVRAGFNYAFNPTPVVAKY
ncbi:outer membrane protein [Bradyrhizobium sp. BR 1432]|uniref:outer membrane protein n=1 Tax=Bradyrhizobium sp. BR 1432 TaxID=3447966 RepID=UPI003EE5EC23